MKDSENQQKFIDLRLQGVSIPKVAGKLGISLSTAKRWNRTYKDDILSIKNEELMNSKKIFFAKYDEMFQFLDSHLSRLKDHLQNNNEIFMSYEKTLLASLKIIDALNKIQSLKKIISESNHTDLLNSFSLFKNPGDEPNPDTDDTDNTPTTTLNAPDFTHNKPDTSDESQYTKNSTLNTNNSALNTNNPTRSTNNPSRSTKDSSQNTNNLELKTNNSELSTKNSALKTKDAALNKPRHKQIIGINYHPVNDTPGVTSETQNNQSLNTPSNTK